MFRLPGHLKLMLAVACEAALCVGAWGGQARDAGAQLPSAPQLEMASMSTRMTPT
jgi:hypothetical protein